MCVFVELCLCAKTCTLGTCTYLNIAYYHPSIPHAPSPSPASHFLSTLFMFCVFFSHSAHFVCPFCLSVSVEYCCSAFAICHRRYAWLARTGGQQTRRKEGVQRGHSISVIDIAALCILSIAYQSLVYQPSS